MQQSDQWSKGSKQNPSTIQTCWTCLNHSSSLWRFLNVHKGARARGGGTQAGAALGAALLQQLLETQSLQPPRQLVPPLPPAFTPVAPSILLQL